MWFPIVMSIFVSGGAATRTDHEGTDAASTTEQQRHKQHHRPVQRAAELPAPRVCSGAARSVAPAVTLTQRAYVK